MNPTQGRLADSCDADRGAAAGSGRILPESWPQWLGWLRPAWVIMAVFFWVMEMPHRVGLVGSAWLVGLLLDVAVRRSRWASTGCDSGVRHLSGLALLRAPAACTPLCSRACVVFAAGAASSEVCPAPGSGPGLRSGVELGRAGAPADQLPDLAVSLSGSVPSQVQQVACRVNRLILASGSPRRKGRAAQSRSAWSFEVQRAPGVDETPSAL